jgi:hypothetical protein
MRNNKRKIEKRRKREKKWKKKINVLKEKIKRYENSTYKKTSSENPFGIFRAISKKFKIKNK